MDIIYSLLDGLLPFAWLKYDFMKNAFVAILLITPLFGILSTMVVSNRMAFFSDSLGHGAFTGLAIGAILGINSPMLALLIFSIFFALLITWIKHKINASADTVIGVFSSIGIAGGLMLMSYSSSFNKYSGYLIGDVLSITGQDIVALFFVLVGVILVWVVLFNKLLMLSINESLAKSRGINSILIEGIFAAVVAVVVAVSIQWVGLLMINSLLVLPAAAARNIAGDIRQYHILSVCFAIFSGTVGIICAYYCNMAVGATIVVCAAMIFFISMCLKNILQR